MTALPTPPPSPRRPILPRWVGLLFPVVLLAAVGAWLAYSVNQTILPFVLALAFSAGLGLLSGFSARWILRGRPFLVRAPAALAAVTVGLLLLGLLTNGAAGIDLAGGAGAAFNVIGLIHLSVGALTALMALSAWRVRVLPQVRPAAPRPARSRPAGPLEQAWVSLAGRWAAFRQDAAEGWRKSGLNRGLHAAGGRFSSLRLRFRLGSIARTEESRPISAAVQPIPRPARASAVVPQPEPAAPAPLTTRQRVQALGRSVFRWRRPSVVRMGKVAEQRCPYCFDVVREQDPRGIVVCSICHTPHHADCWAITGMCQIPHSHT
jgi:hypothetical protein